MFEELLQNGECQYRVCRSMATARVATTIQRIGHLKTRQYGRGDPRGRPCRCILSVPSPVSSMSYVENQEGDRKTFAVAFFLRAFSSRVACRDWSECRCSNRRKSTGDSRCHIADRVRNHWSSAREYRCRR